MGSSALYLSPFMPNGPAYTLSVGRVHFQFKCVVVFSLFFSPQILIGHSSSKHQIPHMSYKKDARLIWVKGKIYSAKNQIVRYMIFLPLHKEIK